jgi:hypothetical protein
VDLCRRCAAVFVLVSKPRAHAVGQINPAALLAIYRLNALLKGQAIGTSRVWRYVRLYPYVAYIDCCFVGVHNPPRHVRLLLMASLSLIPNLQSILLGTSALAVAADVGIVHRSSSNISNCLGERLLHRFTPAGKWNHTHRLKQRWSLHHIASRIKVPRIANRDEQERPLMPVVSTVADNQPGVVDTRGDV